jgi:hypothetical protein
VPQKRNRLRGFWLSQKSREISGCFEGRVEAQNRRARCCSGSGQCRHDCKNSRSARRRRNRRAPGTVDLWNAKVVRSAMGAHFHHTAFHATNEQLFAFLEAESIALWGTDTSGTPLAR